MKTRFRIFWVLLGAASLAILLSPITLYFYGLGFVPEDRDPNQDARISDSAVLAYWRFLGGTGGVHLSKSNPYTFLLDIYQAADTHDSRSEPDAEAQIMLQAARVIMSRHSRGSRPEGWQLGWIAASIWITRHWSAREAILTVISDGYYGNGFYGISEAANGYFGLPLSELGDAELFHLFVTLRAPSGLNLWCNPEKNIEITGRVFDRAGMPRVDVGGGITPVPNGVCAN